MLYYNFIRQKVEESFTDLLYADHSPIEVKLLIKFGKVLWDLPVVNSALIHPVKGLDKDGSVNLEPTAPDILADIQVIFQESHVGVEDIVYVYTSKILY